MLIGDGSGIFDASRPGEDQRSLSQPCSGRVHQAQLGLSVYRQSRLTDRGPVNPFAGRLPWVF